MDDEEFLAGRLDTGFLERRFHPPRQSPQPPLQDLTLITAALEFLRHAQQAAAAAPAAGDGHGMNPWKLAGRVDLMRRRG
jgi:hypothetical protein